VLSAKPVRHLPIRFVQHTFPDQLVDHALY
jgi:hypothetical protein